MKTQYQETLDVLEGIAAVFDRRRQQGHTFITQQAVLDNPKASMIFVTADHAKRTAGPQGVTVMMLDKLMFGEGSVLLDNHVVSEYMGGAARAIRSLAKELHDAEGKLAHIAAVLK